MLPKGAPQRRSPKALPKSAPQRRSSKALPKGAPLYLAPVLLVKSYSRLKILERDKRSSLFCRRVCNDDKEQFYVTGTSVSVEMDDDTVDRTFPDDVAEVVAAPDET